MQSAAPHLDQLIIDARRETRRSVESARRANVALAKLEDELARLGIRLKTVPPNPRVEE